MLPSKSAIPDAASTSRRRNEFSTPSLPRSLRGAAWAWPQSKALRVATEAPWKSAALPERARAFACCYRWQCQKRWPCHKKSDGVQRLLRCVMQTEAEAKKNETAPDADCRICFTTESLHDLTSPANQMCSLADLIVKRYGEEL